MHSSHGVPWRRCRPRCSRSRCGRRCRSSSWSLRLLASCGSASSDSSRGQIPSCAVGVRYRVPPPLSPPRRAEPKRRRSRCADGDGDGQVPSVGTHAVKKMRTPPAGQDDRRLCRPDHVRVECGGYSGRTREKRVGKKMIPPHGSGGQVSGRPGDCWEDDWRFAILAIAALQSGVVHEDEVSSLSW